MAEEKNTPNAAKSESPLASEPADEASAASSNAPPDSSSAQPDMDALLRQASEQLGSAPASDASSKTAAPAMDADLDPPGGPGGEGLQDGTRGADKDVMIGQEDIEFLLNQAQEAISSIDEADDKLPPGIQRFELNDFSGTPPTSEAATLDLVRDVELDVNIELGRTHMHLADVLRLKKGSVVPLDKLAGDPVDIYVNDRLIARGEVLVLNDNFCVRVAELVVGDSPEPHRQEGTPRCDSA